MEGLSQLLQSGGSDAMGLINNQSGGAIQAITLAISVLFPILFFVISKIVHDNLDEGSRGEEDESLDKEDEGFGKKDYILWGLYSIKVNLFMMALCYGLGWMLAWLWFKVPVVNDPGGALSMFWKAAFGFMILTHAYSIIFGGLKSTAYQYFNDELHDNRGKMEKVCVNFGCGWAPHGSQKVSRGSNYRD